MTVFSVRIVNQLYKHYWFLCDRHFSSVFLFPYPILFATGLILSCIVLIFAPVRSDGVMPAFLLAVWWYRSTPCLVSIYLMT